MKKCVTRKEIYNHRHTEISNIGRRRGIGGKKKSRLSRFFSFLSERSIMYALWLKFLSLQRHKNNGVLFKRIPGTARGPGNNSRKIRWTRVIRLTEEIAIFLANYLIH